MFATLDCSSPLQAAFADHRRAVLAYTADPESDASAAAEGALIDAPCSNDAEFVDKLAYLLGVLREQCGREPCYGDDFEVIAYAVATYLPQRKRA